jgi:uncharacterized membrane protein YhiD involved in acid resistance
LSYSKSFVGSLIVIPMVVALVMMVLQNNLVTAFGMMAVFAIVRFRNILRDTLDTTYVLAVIVVGMACGTRKYTTAMIGCGLMVVIVLYLFYTDFGVRHRYHVIVNLHWSRDLAELEELRRTLHRHSRKSICASQRSGESYPGTDLSYRLLMRDPERIEELLVELRAIQGVSRVTSLQAQDESEM